MKYDAKTGPVLSGQQSQPDASRANVYVQKNSHPLSMGRRFSLRRNKQFQYLYRKGKSYPARQLVLIYLRGRGFKAGFSVSSKVGNAVVRNRVRRRMREQVRLIRPRLKSGQYIFVARASAAQASSPELCKTLSYLVTKAELWNDVEKK